MQHFTVTDGSSVMSITHTLRLGSICIRYKMECKNFIEKLGNCHAVYTDLVLVYFEVRCCHFVLLLVVKLIVLLFIISSYSYCLSSQFHTHLQAGGCLILICRLGAVSYSSAGWGPSHSHLQDMGCLILICRLGDVSYLSAG